MKARFILFFYVVMLLSAVVLATQAIAQEPQPPVKLPGVVETKTLIETASAAGNFTTLLKAVEAAGLTETLKGAGPYTWFAPTDEAFAKLPAGTLDDLMKDKEKLKTLLLNHVVSGTMLAREAANQKTAKALGGTELTIQATEGNLTIQNATVVKGDLTARNGVLHAIDAVLLPAQSVPAHQ